MKTKKSKATPGPWSKIGTLVYVPPAQDFHFYEFSAPWCGPCKSMVKVMENLLDSPPPNVVVHASMNVDDDRETEDIRGKTVPGGDGRGARMARRFDVQSVPTYVLCSTESGDEPQKGDSYCEESGAIGEERLREWIQSAETALGGVESKIKVNRIRRTVHEPEKI